VTQDTFLLSSLVSELFNAPSSKQAEVYGASTSQKRLHSKSCVFLRQLTTDSSYVAQIVTQDTFLLSSLVSCLANDSTRDATCGIFRNILFGSNLAADALVASGAHVPLIKLLESDVDRIPTVCGILQRIASANDGRRVGDLLDSGIVGTLVKAMQTHSEGGSRIHIAAWEALTNIACACGGAIVSKHLGWQIRLDIAKTPSLLECMLGSLLNVDESVVVAACSCTLQLLDAPADTSGRDAMEQIGILMGEHGVCSALVTLISHANRLVRVTVLQTCLKLAVWVPRGDVPQLMALIEPQLARISDTDMASVMELLDKLSPRENSLGGGSSANSPSPALVPGAGVGSATGSLTNKSRFRSFFQRRSKAGP